MSLRIQKGGPPLFRAAGVSDANIRAAFERPDSVHVIRADELTVRICLKRPRRGARHLPYLVVADQKKEHGKDFCVSAALKVPPSIVVDDDAEPLTVLEAFANHCGFPVRICGKISYFFVTERVPLLQTDGELVSVVDSGNKPFTMSCYVKVYEAYAEPYVVVALAFSIADHLYLPAIGR